MPRAEPAIRAALEAAALAVSEATLDWGDDPPEIWGGHRETAAAAIAAFLRALSPCDVMMQRWTNDNPPQQDGPHSTITLAAAVTAAAEDGQ